MTKNKNKKSIMTWAMLALVWCASSLVQAQTVPHGGVPGKLGGPGEGLGLVLGAIGSRIHTVYGGMNNLIHNMEISGQKTYRGMVGIKGALVYDHEMVGKGIFPGNEVGRDTGFQVIPFEVELTDKGGVLISAAPIGFRNMNSAPLDSLMVREKVSYSSTKSAERLQGFWRHVDQMQILQFTFDNRRPGIQDFQFTIVNAEVKAAVLKWENGSSRDSWIGSTIELSAGYRSTRFDLTGVLGLPSTVETRQFVAQGFNFIGKFGLEIVLSAGKHTRIALRSKYVVAAQAHERHNAGIPTANRFNTGVQSEAEISRGFTIKDQPVRIGAYYHGYLPITDNLNVNGANDYPSFQVPLIGNYFMTQHGIGLRFLF